MNESWRQHRKLVIFSLAAWLAILVGCANPKMGRVDFQKPSSCSAFEFSVKPQWTPNLGAKCGWALLKIDEAEPAIEQYCVAVCESMFAGDAGAVRNVDEGGFIKSRVPILKLTDLTWTTDQFCRFTTGFSRVTTGASASWAMYSSSGDLIWEGNVEGGAKSSIWKTEGKRAARALEALYVETCDLLKNSPVLYEYERFADLHEAAEQDKPAVFEQSLANVKLQPDWEQSAVMLAYCTIRMDRHDLYARLAALEVDLDQYGPARKRKPFHLAAQLGRLDILRDLLSKCDRIDEESREGLSAMAYAALHEQADCAALLVSMGAQPTAALEEGQYQTAKANEFLARTFFSRGFNEEAQSCARASEHAYREAGKSFKKQMARAGRKIWAMRFLMGAGAAMQQAGASYQAKMQARTMNQISALKRADTHSEYFSIVQSQRGTNAAVPMGLNGRVGHGTPFTLEEGLYHGDVRTLRTSLEELWRECESKSSEMSELQKTICRSGAE